MILNYKCPNCGASMTYDIEKKVLHCDHCDHSEDVLADDASYTEGIYDPGEETKEYHCTNCGGVLVTTGKTTSTHCEFCGAPVVLAERLKGKMRPKQLIPFEVTRKQAEAAFKKWCKNGRFSPKGFMSAKNIQRIKAMYVPYWVFNMDTHVRVGGVAENVRVFRQGDTEITETDFYNVQREMEMSYTNVPYDAQEKLEDGLMAKIEPYNFKSVKTFEMPYLAGFVSEQYDYDDKALMPNVKKKVENYAIDYARGNISGYSSVQLTEKQVDYKNVDSAYTLMPLWFVDYNYHGQEYKFVMNGQTGKVVGTSPISKGKIGLWWAGISTAVFAVLMVIGGLL